MSSDLSFRSIDLEEQFMMHRSRAEDITLRDDAINNGMLLPTDDFQSMENEFGGMLEDIEIPRRASTLQDHSQLGDTSQINLPAETTGDNLMETDKQSHVLDEQGLDRAGFGGGFGDGFGDFGQFGLQEDLLNASNMPQLDELNFEASGLGQPESDQQAKDNEEPMEVDRPAPAPRVPEESLREEEGFILEPIDVSGIKVRQRRKRKLIVDKEMELKGDFIRAQLQDHSDTLQVKCFPPPTKKALLWKESASVEQLYHNPTMHGVTSVLSNLITRNLRSLNTADLKIDTSLLKDIEVPRDDVPLGNSTIEDSLIPITDMPLDPPVGDMLDEMKEAEFDLDHRDNMDDQLLPLTSTNALEQDLEGEDARISRVIPELPDLEGDAENEQDKDQLTATTEEQSGEAGEERRWNKRTQQVLRMLEKCFNQTDSLHFNDLTRKCSRKQAASRFYSCLLLAKEGAIQFQQDQPYSDIVIEQGPLYAQAV